MANKKVSEMAAATQVNDSDLVMIVQDGENKSAPSLKFKSEKTIISKDSLPIGSVIEWYSDEIPDNWLICDGSAVSRSLYNDLYKVLGTRYGAGNGSSTFNLPDLKDRIPIGKNTSNNNFNVLGKTGGEEQHQMTIYELPKHNHAINTANRQGDMEWGYQFLYDNSTAAYNGMMQYIGESQPFNILQPYIVCHYIIKAINPDPVQTADEIKVIDDSLPIGCTVEWHSDIEPEDWLICNGQTVDRNEYAELFEVLGTRYGNGDGTTTFALPDLRGRVPVGKNGLDSDFDILGKTLGEKTHKLAAEEMPIHRHRGIYNEDSWSIIVNQKTSGDTVGYAIPEGPVRGKDIVMSTEIAGGDQSHNNIQPSLIVNFIIKAKKKTKIGAKVINDLTNTSETDALSANQGRILNEKIEALSVGEGSQRHIVTMYTQTVNVQAESDTKINASSRYVKVGSKLSVSNGNVKIGAGVSKVLVSAHILLDEAQVHHHFLYVYYNDNLWHRLDSYGRYDSIDMAPSLLPVSEGDEIGLVVRAGSTTTVYESSYLTVEVIE